MRKSFYGAFTDYLNTFTHKNWKEVNITTTPILSNDNVYTIAYLNYRDISEDKVTNLLCFSS